MRSSASRYLPHLPSAEVLRMGLSPLGKTPWIETDADIGRYHRHKLALRRQRGDQVYRASPDSLAAQRELAALLREHLLRDQARHYRRRGAHLYCLSGDFDVPLEGDEPLWLCSLWVADDLVIMQPSADGYRLTAASLCSPSHWHLADKFGRPLREIHAPVPGLNARLAPPIDRFLGQLQPGRPFVRCNWALQAGDALAGFPGEEPAVEPDTPLYYRTERQSLQRLPQSGAVAFTIRVYLAPLESLAAGDGALPALLQAVERTPPALARYKGLLRLAPALEKYRALS